MGKQTRSKKSESIGKGKVTPVQIAFIVDRYLSDNNFSETRSVFRNEASSFISKSPVQEAPKSLLSLGAILNEYICLKEQKVMLDQERARLELEKFRVQTLLQGMQNAMNAYNSSGTAPTPMIQASATRSVAIIPQPDPCVGSPPGCPTYKSPTIMPVSTPSNAIMQRGNLSSPITNHPLTRKRTSSNIAVEGPSAAKKCRSQLTSGKMPTKGKCKQSDGASATTQKIAQPSYGIGCSPSNGVPSGPLVQGSSVAKSLFNQAVVSPPPSSSGPNTPPQPVSSQNDKSGSPMGVSSNANCGNINTPQVITPNNCTVITSERVTVSPCKHISYTVERNRCISSPSPVKTTLNKLSKRDYVKGRLDFDGSAVTESLDKPVLDEVSTSESDKEVDIFDMDLPNLDAFSFSELLVDLDLGCEGLVCPCQPYLGASADNLSGSSHESRDGNQGPDQVMSEFSSTMTEVISEKDMQGPDTITAVKSIKKCMTVSSPAKNPQENCLARN